MEVVNTTGRRKSAIARIYMNDGKGQITVNNKDYKEYFPQEYIQANVSNPFNIVQSESELDVKINVKGGGFKGQAEAIRLAISRALVKMNEDNRKLLKVHKYLSRDARVVERKKYGKPKARKSFQFSKR